MVFGRKKQDDAAAEDAPVGDGIAQPTNPVRPVPEDVFSVSFRDVAVYFTKPDGEIDDEKKPENKKFGHRTDIVTKRASGVDGAAAAAKVAQVFPVQEGWEREWQGTVLLVDGVLV